MGKWMWLAAGGVCGTISRYLLMAAASTWIAGAFPFGTFVVNLVGCFALGVLAGTFPLPLASHHELYFFAIAGFLSAFTTFSTLIFETWQLLIAGRPMLAAMNMAGSVVCGMAALWLGMAIGRWR